jgi:hypothetical protein
MLKNRHSWLHNDQMLSCKKGQVLFQDWHLDQTDYKFTTAWSKSNTHPYFQQCNKKGVTEYRAFVTKTTDNWSMAESILTKINFAWEQTK